jgi:hypothetical protein
LIYPKSVFPKWPNIGTVFWATVCLLWWHGPHGVLGLHRSLSSADSRASALHYLIRRLVPAEFSGGSLRSDRHWRTELSVWQPYLSKATVRPCSRQLNRFHGSYSGWFQVQLEILIYRAFGCAICLRVEWSWHEQRRSSMWTQRAWLFSSLSYNGVTRGISDSELRVIPCHRRVRCADSKRLSSLSRSTIE